MNFRQVGAIVQIVGLEIFRPSITPIIKTILGVRRPIGGHDADIVDNEHRPAQKFGELAADHYVEVLAGIDLNCFIATDVIAHTVSVGANKLIRKQFAPVRDFRRVS